MLEYFNIIKLSKIEEDSLGMKRMFREIVVNIENQAGTERVGIDPKGKEWRSKMKYDYGFICNIKGADGEGLDVYLGPDQEAENVYIIHQNNPETGEYDEDKVMLGFKNQNEAKKSYLEHYDSPKFFGSMSTMKFNKFQDIVINGNFAEKEDFCCNIKDKRKTSKLTKESYFNLY
jgi:inorganic pyrophosphatase